jgi:hypothetical protein
MDQLKLRCALMTLAFLSLTACENSERYSLVANAGQIGRGTIISMVGKTGTIHADPLPGYLKGLDEQVKEIERPVGSEGEWKFETEHKMILSFIVGAGNYICDSCNSVGLPFTWHRVTAE